MAIHEFRDLLGKTLETVVVSDDMTEVRLELADGRRFRLFHEQDCCEQVWLEEIIGDLADICGAPLVEAEEVSGGRCGGRGDNTRTWTFYRFATRKGCLVLRWCSLSNGYYSETVDFGEVTGE